MIVKDTHFDDKTENYMGPTIDLPEEQEIKGTDEIEKIVSISNVDSKPKQEEK